MLETEQIFLKDELFHVMDDEIMDADVCIGRPVLDRTDLRMTAESVQLKFERLKKVDEWKFDPSPVEDGVKEKLTVRIDGNQLIPPHAIKFINVKARSSPDGTCYIETGCGSKPGSFAMESFNEIKNSKTRIPRLIAPRGNYNSTMPIS